MLGRCSSAGPRSGVARDPGTGAWPVPREPADREGHRIAGRDRYRDVRGSRASRREDGEHLNRSQPRGPCREDLELMVPQAATPLSHKGTSRRLG